MAKRTEGHVNSVLGRHLLGRCRPSRLAGQGLMIVGLVRANIGIGPNGIIEDVPEDTKVPLTRESAT